MSKVFMNKRKTVTSIIAVALTAVIIFGGTFAWQSISQEALNEVAATRNPGGRLHDDFVDITYDSEGNKKYDTMTFNKDVYVENFTSYADNGVQVFARVRLDEYMELGENAGVAGNTTAKSVVYGAELDNKNTWTTHVPGENSVFNEEDPFHEYWNWDIITDSAKAADGVVTYMPTYNKNKDSLEADINGTFDKEFTDYVDYNDQANATANNFEIVDNDSNDTDELDNDYVDLNNVITGDQKLGENYVDQHVTVTQKEHTVETSLDAYVMTMDEWLKLPADQQTGNFWVWDRDGWAYWANPINPETATGVLLNGISRKENVINEDWYYAINVVAQFITKDNLGKEDGNGFYDLEAGGAPSTNALTLLKAIGVEVDTTVKNNAEFENALKLGGNITVDGNLAADGVISAEELGTNFNANYAWTTGGSLTGLKDADGKLISSIKTANEAYAGMFINTENNYPDSGDGATATVINDMKFEGENVGYAVYVQAINAPVTFNTVTATNTLGGGIYAEWGGARVTINGCTVTAPTADTGAKDWQLSAVAAANNAEVVINGGTYIGKYAAYVYNSGGTITINDGTFRGELKNDAGNIIIKGGSFSVDPSRYVDTEAGYTVSYDEATQLYTVK